MENYNNRLGLRNYTMIYLNSMIKDQNIQQEIVCYSNHG